MAVYEHKGLDNIPEADRCPTCSGNGWVRTLKANGTRFGHPCPDCYGDGEIKEKK